MPTAGKTHDIVLTINGTDYGFNLVSPQAFRQVDISDFAPRVSSGQITYSDFTLWQVWAQDDWQHGFGFPYFTDEWGYARSGNYVDTRHNGIAILATAIDTTNGETGESVIKFVDFNDKLYALQDGNSGVRVWDGSSWADLSYIGDLTFTSAGLNDLSTSGTYTGTSDLDYVVEIDGAGSPDTFKWSDDGGSTWDATGVAITGSAQTLNNGVEITFANTTGHAVGDRWEFTAHASEIVEAEFHGTGPDDLTASGTFTHTGDIIYRVEIDGTGETDTFKVSDDDGVTWDDTGTPITPGTAQDLTPNGNDYGVDVTFDSRTGHTKGDYWRIKAKAAYIDDVSEIDFSHPNDLDDLTIGGTFTGRGRINYRVEIDGTGTPDTFKWSDDGGATWDATGVAITGDAQTLNNGVTITFGATTGHVLGSRWDFIATALKTGTCYDAVSTGDYLFVAINEARMHKIDTNGKPSYMGKADNPPNDIRVLCIHGGYLWAAEDGTSYLHYASEPDGSDLEGGGNDDIDVIEVGPGQIPIVNMISYNNNLYVAREDGLWVVSNDKLAYQVQDFSRERHSINFQTMCVWRGALYFNVRNRLYRYTGSTLQDVTPPRYVETFPYRAYGNFRCLTPRGKFLYVIAEDNEASAHDNLLAYDGVGWHRICSLADSPYQVNTMNYSSVDHDALWFNYTRATNSPVTAEIRLQALNDLPYDYYETSGDHYLYTSKFDGGLQEIDKCFKSVTLRTNYLAAGTRTISVEYSLDGGAWKTDLTDAGGTGDNTVDQSPVQTLYFPSDTTGKQIQLRFNLQTTDSSTSPVLEAFSVKYMLRPVTTWGWRLIVTCAEEEKTLDGRRDSITGKAKLAALRTARDSTAPITFYDPWGDSHTVYLSSLQVIGREHKPGGGEALETQVQITLVEV